jgi:hypothetical protein
MIAVLVSACVLLCVDAAAHPAWSILLDRQGQVYFSDLETVWKIDAGGRLAVFRPGVSGRHVHELMMDEEGNLYGPDYTYVQATGRYLNAIWKMTPDGRQTYLLAATDKPQRGLGVLRDRDGNTYAFEQDNHLKRETLILKRTPGGEVTVLAGSGYGYADGKGREAKFTSIIGAAFGADGSLYLADSSSVRKVTMDGTVTTLAAGLDLKDRDPSAAGDELAWGSLMGLSVNAAGEVFVADFRNRRVLKVTPGGVVSTVARAATPWSPTGVAVAPGGDLYILEYGFIPPGTWKEPRVRRVSPDGKASVLVTLGETRHGLAMESSGGEDSDATNGPARRAIPYALIGAAMGLFALTIVAWRAYRRKVRQEH